MPYFFQNKINLLARFQLVIRYVAKREQLIEYRVFKLCPAAQLRRNSGDAVFAAQEHFVSLGFGEMPAGGVLLCELAKPHGRPVAQDNGGRKRV